MYYAKDNHPPIVSEKTWEKAQRKLEDMRAERAEHSVIQEFTEENYPYMNKIYCAKCGYPLYKRIYSKGNRLNWGCSGTKRYGRPSVMALISRMVCSGVRGILKKTLILLRKHWIRE